MLIKLKDTINTRNSSTELKIRWFSYDEIDNMSSPRNILDAFRSYSYHHILIVCDGTESAENLAKQQEITLFDHEGDGNQTKYCPRKVPNNSGRYIVLINGMSDTEYVIQDVSWSTVLMPNEQTKEGTTHFRTMAVDGEMTIQEPMGVSFLNQINNASRSLGVDANSMIFLLKTIFVGIRDDGKREIITGVRPLLLTAYDITAMFDVTGAEYKLSFVGVANGTSRLPYISSVAGGFYHKINSGESLRTTFKSLERKINEYYLRRKTELKKQAEQSNTSINFDDFIDVRYKIHLDDQYTDHYKAGTAPLVTNSDSGTDDPIITSGSSITIEGIIDAIMKSSQAVLDEGNVDKKDKISYKITSSVITSPSKYEVHYHVNKFKTPIVPAAELFTFEPPIVDGVRQGIEFDYTFTGKNTDVLSMDIKMQMGMAFFQTLSVASSLPTNTQDIKDKQNPQLDSPGANQLNGPGDSKTDSTCESTGNVITKKKPLFLGMSVRDSSIRNVRTPTSAASYNALLARHAAFENLDTRMSIRGNPQLLEETTFVPTFDNPQVLYVDDANRPDDEAPRPIMPTTYRTPGYVKVNIYMPNAYMENDPTSFESRDYSRNFWYPGWYYVYSITHRFSDGEFTQELEMMSLPTDDGQHNLNATSPNS